MTPNNAPSAQSDPAHVRKPSHAAPRRVAIPLPLSRPRVKKPAPKPEPETPVEQEVIEAGNEVPREVEGITRSDEEKKDAPSVDYTNTAEAVDAASPVDSSPAEEKHEVPLTNGNKTAVPSSELSQPATLSDSTVGAAGDKSSPSSRKPAHSRTELPPAFVPSAGQQTPRSSTSSVQFSRNSQVFHPQSHLSRPSTSSIVFGGEDSSASSLAPPRSAADSDSAQAPPSNEQRDAQAPSYNAQSHNHHYFDSQSHQYPVPHSQQPWQYQQQYPPARHPPGFHHHTNSNFRYPPREPFFPGGPHAVNGHASLSRSASPASATANGDLRSPMTAESATNGSRSMAFELRTGQSFHRQANSYRQMPPQVQSYPDHRFDLENAQQLRDHVMVHYADPSLSDCHLQITQDTDGSRSYLDAHKLILARSSKMLDLIRRSNDPAAAHLKTQVYVSLRGRYITLTAFSECVRYLYGGPLLQFDQQLRSMQSASDPLSVNEDRMQHALQYIATSAWLRLHTPAVRGVEVCASLLHWNTLSAVLGFALEGGLSSIWTIEDGSEDPGSTTSSDDSLNPAEPTTTNPTFDPYATELLRHMLYFIVTTFPQNFYPDISAPQLPSSPRLPNPPTSSPINTSTKHEKNKPSRSDPRLSNIRFGELPPAEPARPSATTTAISSLLFSLPYQLLKALLEHPVLADRLGMETAGSIMRQVIVEREARRVKTTAAMASEEDGLTSKFAALDWVESVEVSSMTKVGLRLARRRRGVDTPASTGTVEEGGQCA